jgi:hypothetical protein
VYFVSVWVFAVTKKVVSVFVRFRAPLQRMGVNPIAFCRESQRTGYKTLREAEMNCTLVCHVTDATTLGTYYAIRRRKKTWNWRITTMRQSGDGQARSAERERRC